jgi:hypothetical protein
VKVRIKGDISGSRNGAPWPARGETIELPDDEGAQLCASGLAAPVKNADIEEAVPDDDAEKRDGLTTENSGALTSDGDTEQEQAKTTAPAKTAAPAKKTSAPAKKTAAPTAKPSGDSK